MLVMFFCICLYSKIIEEIQLLKLEIEYLDDTKFDDWSRNDEDTYMFMRRL